MEWVFHVNKVIFSIFSIVVFKGGSFQIKLVEEKALFAKGFLVLFTTPSKSFPLIFNDLSHNLHVKIIVRIINEVS